MKQQLVALWKRHWPLAAIVTAGLVVRAAALAYAARLPYFLHPRTDEAIFVAGAKAFAAGSWGLGPHVLHMSPLYYYFVGVVYWIFGSGPWPLRIIQLLLGLATIVLVYFGARSLDEKRGERIGLVAAAVMALYGPAIFYEAQILPEALGVFCHALFFWLGMRAIRKQTRLAWLEAGMGCGFATIVRPNALLLAIPLVVCIALERTHSARRRLLLSSIVAAGCATVILPITLRNYLQAGEPVLVTDTGGLNFFIGNGPGATGVFRVPAGLPQAYNVEAQLRAFTAAAEQQEGRQLTAREVDRFWYGRTWRSIGAAPRRWIRLLFEKLLLFWGPTEFAVVYDYDFVRGLNPILGLPLVQFRLLAPLAAVGTVLLLAFGWRGRKQALFAGLGNLVFCASVVMFFVLSRYRIPGIPMLAAAFAVTVDCAVEWIRGRRVVPLGAAAAAAAIVAIGWGPRFRKPADDEWFKLGYAYHVQGRSADAEKSYLRAIELNPNSLEAHRNLAFLYADGGDAERASHEWQEVSRIANVRSDRAHVEEAAAQLQKLQTPLMVPNVDAQPPRQ